MNEVTFNANRRQNFLSLQAYHATRANQLALLAVEHENLKVAAPNREDLANSYEMIWLESLWLWMLDYTAGANVSELAGRVSDLVDKFEQWNDRSQDFFKLLSKNFPEDGAYSYGAAIDLTALGSYEDFTQLLSIAIIVRDVNSVERLIQIMRADRGRDALLETLFAPYVEQEIEVSDCIFEEPYSYLMPIFFTENDTEALSLLNEYLTRWYPAMNTHLRWYDSHLNNDDNGCATYYGYWAFEAGAAAFQVSLNTNLVDHPVYPRHLVEYGELLHEAGLYTSLGKSSVVPTLLRAVGGSPCPRSGYWYTPSQTESEKFFELGVPLPIFDSEYGLTIWQCVEPS